MILLKLICTRIGNLYELMSLYLMRCCHHCCHIILIDDDEVYAGMDFSSSIFFFTYSRSQCENVDVISNCMMSWNVFFLHLQSLLKLSENVIFSFVCCPFMFVTVIRFDYVHLLSRIYIYRQFFVYFLFIRSHKIWKFLDENYVTLFNICIWNLFKISCSIYTYRVILAYWHLINCTHNDYTLWKH